VDVIVAGVLVDAISRRSATLTRPTKSTSLVQFFASTVSVVLFVMSVTA